MTASPLIFVQLNEVNFDFVAHYVRKYDDLPAFKRLLTSFRSLETRGEERYEHLEPWIQWVSAHTGKTFEDHGVFRLGDVVSAPESLVQIFETLEGRGLNVGAISPMNARNRLRHPAYFVPDPWTDTPPDKTGFAARLTRMLRQTVNENATGRIKPSSLLALAEAMLVTFNPRQTWRLLRSIIGTRRQPWTKALVLDQLLHLVHLHFWRRRRPDVSFVFMNAGAHIQHHYLFNAEPARGASKNPDWYVPAEADPVRDMLRAYDRILGDYLALEASGVRLLVATGLTQVPYDRVKFYYRLKDHVQFMRVIGLHPTRVLPRMTRDFEAEFADSDLAQAAADRLGRITMERDGRTVFGDIELREARVFASLTYPDEIRADDRAVMGGGLIVAGFGDMVAFVAIKNGMHSTRGFAFFSPNTPLPASATSPVHVSRLFDLTLVATTP